MSGLISEGWLWRRPLKAPNVCRHCGGPFRLVNGGRALACEECDMTKEWPRARRTRKSR